MGLKTGLITGSNGDLGYAVSQRLSQGYNVVGFDRLAPSHPPPSAHIEQPVARAVRKRYEVPVEPLADRARHVVQSVLAGRRIVILSGGPFEADEQVFENMRGIRDGGGFSSILGRNAFRRPRDKALRLLSTVMGIYAGAAG